MIQPRIYRRALLASVAASALTCGTAYADPMNPWTGPYVGLAAGYVGTTMDINDAQGNLLPNFAPNSKFTVSGSGVIAGGEAGYNWQFGHFLLGAEGDFSGSSASATVSQSGIRGTEALVLHSQLTELGTIRARIGFVFDSMPLMIFGTGGAAFGNVTDSATNVFGPGNDFTEYHKQGWRTGWTAGGGGEWLFAPGWSLKAEVLYVDLGSTTVTSPELPTSCHEGFSDTNIIGRIGINFHF